MWLGRTTAGQQAVRICAWEGSARACSSRPSTPPHSSKPKSVRKIKAGATACPSSAWWPRSDRHDQRKSPSAPACAKVVFRALKIQSSGVVSPNTLCSQGVEQPVSYGRRKGCTDLDEGDEPPHARKRLLVARRIARRAARLHAVPLRRARDGRPEQKLPVVGLRASSFRGGQISGPFPPAVAHRRLLSTPSTAIRVAHAEPMALRVRAAQAKARNCGCMLDGPRGIRRSRAWRRRGTRGRRRRRAACGMGEDTQARCQARGAVCTLHTQGEVGADAGANPRPALCGAYS